MAGVLSDKFYLMGNGDMLYLYDIHIMNMIDIENRVKEMENNINTMKENRYAKGKDDKDEKAKDDKDKEDKEEKDKEEAIPAQLKMIQLMEKKANKKKGRKS